MSDTIRICKWCGQSVPVNDFCSTCVVELASRPNADTMSGEARINELVWFFTGPGQFVEVSFGDMHGRMEALMGRPVWTHEFADPSRLLEEARTRLMGDRR